MDSLANGTGSVGPERPCSESETAKPSTGEAGRLNNAALVTQPKLLHFGLDYLRICLGEVSTIKSRCIQFFTTIFSLPHNDSNTPTYNDFLWADTDESVNLHFAKTPFGEACYVSSDGWNIFCIERLSEKSSFFKNTGGIYQYVVSFYGDFFGRIKLGLNPDTFWRILDDDIREDLVYSTVSRVDICADIQNLSVLDIEKGIKVRSYKHAKKFTRLNVDWETNIPETFYYGGSGDKHWHARVYNKLKDIDRKHKEVIYQNYWGMKCVTRLEVELHECCREYRINFLNCRNAELQLSVLVNLLKTKYVRWKIVPFLLRQAKEIGIDSFALQRVQPDYTQLSNLRFYKDTVSKNVSCIQRTGIPLDTFFQRLRIDVEKFIISRSGHAQP